MTILENKRSVKSALNPKHSGLKAEITFQLNLQYLNAKMQMYITSWPSDILT